MTTNSLLYVWLILALVVGWWLGRWTSRSGSQRPSSTTAPPRVQFTIEVDLVDGKPGVTRDPHVRLGDAVEWLVKNSSGVPMEIALANFTVKGTTQQRVVLDTLPSVPVHGHAAAPLRANVCPDALTSSDPSDQFGRYQDFKYDILIGGQVVSDPEVRIRG